MLTFVGQDVLLQGQVQPYLVKRELHKPIHCHYLGTKVAQANKHKKADRRRGSVWRM
jgi:hypothetical protein